jgi:iron complex transport system substrate-binding protein
MTEVLMQFRKLTAIAFMIALALVLLVGCSSADEGTSDESISEAAESEAASAAEAVFPVTVTDDAGREVTIESEPRRIVSLAPANTEIVAALGLIDRLVGVTTYDDYPPEVADIEKIGDFITPNLEAIAAAQPDLVLATTGVQADVVQQLEALGAVVIAIDPQTLESVSNAIMIVGQATGAVDEASETVEEMHVAIEAVVAAVSTEEPVPCFLEIAQDPLFTVGDGTLLGDLITVAGGQNVVTQSGYVGYSLEQLITDDPDVYMATLGSMSDPADLAARPGFDGLSAVTESRVYVLDDNLVSRPGPRIVEGLRQIAEALHPDVF